MKIGHRQSLGLALVCAIALHHCSLAAAAAQALPQQDSAEPFTKLPATSNRKLVGPHCALDVPCSAARPASRIWGPAAGGMGPLPQRLPRALHWRAAPLTLPLCPCPTAPMQAQGWEVVVGIIGLLIGGTA